MCCPAFRGNARPSGLVALALIAVACGRGGDGGTEPSHRGIRIVSGQNVSDTAFAVLPQAVIVEIRDERGNIAPAGTVVEFQGAPALARLGLEVLVKGLTLSNFEATVTATTDAAGRTGAFVQLSAAVGAARLVISVPSLGLSDTARFTITPGAAARLIVTPADTAIYTGRSYTLRAIATDAHGNVRNDPVTWSTIATGVTLSSTGQISATQIGRYAVAATVATIRQTAQVSVVPQGRLVAVDPRLRIIAANIDGSDQQHLTTVVDGGIGPHPRWIPGTNSVIYTHVDGGQRIHVVDENGTVRRFFAATPSQMGHQAEPEPSLAGQWLYFSAYDTRCGANFYCLYRARLDGTGAEMLGNVIESSKATWRPAPSPDGSRVAFVTNETPAPTIRVLTLESRAVSAWRVTGDHPSWSPNGTQIAFLRSDGGPLMLMDTDGGNVRVLSDRPYVGESVAWSRDGLWLIARVGSVLELVEVATGLVLPLPQFRDFRYPGFR